jgi:hypothetical protein
MTIADAAGALEQTLESSRGPLLAIAEEEASRRSGPENWSKKEILGHLIDSASNNHQRFVRLQLEPLLVMPSYRQNEWVRTQSYHERGWRDLVELWTAYNRHLAHVIRHCDPKAAKHVWQSPDKEYTLEHLIEDYLRHLRHHVTQILGASAAA